MPDRLIPDASPARIDAERAKCRAVEEELARCREQLAAALDRVADLERENAEGDAEYKLVLAKLEQLQRAKAANDRAWDLVKLWRLEAMERGEEQYGDPKQQALSAALVGTEHHQATVDALRPHGLKS